MKRLIAWMVLMLIILSGCNGTMFLSKNTSNSIDTQSVDMNALLFGVYSKGGAAEVLTFANLTKRKKNEEGSSSYIKSAELNFASGDGSRIISGSRAFFLGKVEATEDNPYKQISHEDGTFIYFEVLDYIEDKNMFIYAYQVALKNAIGEYSEMVTQLMAYDYENEIYQVIFTQSTSPDEDMNQSLFVQKLPNKSYKSYTSADGVSSWKEKLPNSVESSYIYNDTYSKEPTDSNYFLYFGGKAYYYRWEESASWDQVYWANQENQGISKYGAFVNYGEYDLSDGYMRVYYQVREEKRQEYKRLGVGNAEFFELYNMSIFDVKAAGDDYRDIYMSVNIEYNETAVDFSDSNDDSFDENYSKNTLNLTIAYKLYDLKSEDVYSKKVAKNWDEVDSSYDVEGESGWGEAEGAVDIAYFNAPDGKTLKLYKFDMSTIGRYAAFDPDEFFANRTTSYSALSGFSSQASGERLMRDIENELINGELSKEKSSMLSPISVVPDDLTSMFTSVYNEKTGNQVYYHFGGYSVEWNPSSAQQYGDSVKQVSKTAPVVTNTVIEGYTSGAEVSFNDFVRYEELKKSEDYTLYSNNYTLYSSDFSAYSTDYCAYLDVDTGMSDGTVTKYSATTKVEDGQLFPLYFEFLELNTGLLAHTYVPNNPFTGKFYSESDLKSSLQILGTTPSTITAKDNVYGYSIDPATGRFVTSSQVEEKTHASIVWRDNTTQLEVDKTTGLFADQESAKASANSSMIAKSSDNKEVDPVTGAFKNQSEVNLDASDITALDNLTMEEVNPKTGEFLSRTNVVKFSTEANTVSQASGDNKSGVSVSTYNGQNALSSSDTSVYTEGISDSFYYSVNRVFKYLYSMGDDSVREYVVINDPNGDFPILNLKGYTENLSETMSETITKNVSNIYPRSSFPENAEAISGLLPTGYTYSESDAYDLSKKTATCKSLYYIMPGEISWTGMQEVISQTSTEGGAYGEGTTASSSYYFKDTTIDTVYRTGVSTIPSRTYAIYTAVDYASEGKFQKIGEIKTPEITLYKYETKREVIKTKYERKYASVEAVADLGVAGNYYYSCQVISPGGIISADGAGISADTFINHGTYNGYHTDTHFHLINEGSGTIYRQENPVSLSYEGNASKRIQVITGAENSSSRYWAKGEAFTDNYFFRADDADNTYVSHSIQTGNGVILMMGCYKKNYGNRLIFHYIAPERLTNGAYSTDSQNSYAPYMGDTDVKGYNAVTFSDGYVYSNSGEGGGELEMFVEYSSNFRVNKEDMWSGWWFVGPYYFDYTKKFNKVDMDDTDHDVGRYENHFKAKTDTIMVTETTEVDGYNRYVVPNASFKTSRESNGIATPAWVAEYIRIMAGKFVSKGCTALRKISNFITTDAYFSEVYLTSTKTPKSNGTVDIGGINFNTTNSDNTRPFGTFYSFSNFGIYNYGPCYNNRKRGKRAGYTTNLEVGKGLINDTGIIYTREGEQTLNLLFGYTVSPSISEPYTSVEGSDYAIDSKISHLDLRDVKAEETFISEELQPDWIINAGMIKRLQQTPINASDGAANNYSYYLGVGDSAFYFVPAAVKRSNSGGFVKTYMSSDKLEMNNPNNMLKVTFSQLLNSGTDFSIDLSENEMDAVIIDNTVGTMSITVETPEDKDKEYYYGYATKTNASVDEIIWNTDPSCYNKPFDVDKWIPSNMDDTENRSDITVVYYEKDEIRAENIREGSSEVYNRAAQTLTTRAASGAVSTKQMLPGEYEYYSADKQNHILILDKTENISMEYDGDMFLLTTTYSDGTTEETSYDPNKISFQSVKKNVTYYIYRTEAVGEIQYDSDGLPTGELEMDESKLKLVTSYYYFSDWTVGDIEVTAPCTYDEDGELSGIYRYAYSVYPTGYDLGDSSWREVYAGQTVKFEGLDAGKLYYVFRQTGSYDDNESEGNKQVSISWSEKVQEGSYYITEGATPYDDLESSGNMYDTSGAEEILTEISTDGYTYGEENYGDGDGSLSYQLTPKNVFYLDQTSFLVTSPDIGIVQVDIQRNKAPEGVSAYSYEYAPLVSNTASVSKVSDGIYYMTWKKRAEANLFIALGFDDDGSQYLEGDLPFAGVYKLRISDDKSVERGVVSETVRGLVNSLLKDEMKTIVSATSIATAYNENLYNNIGSAYEAYVMADAYRLVTESRTAGNETDLRKISVYADRWSEAALKLAAKCYDKVMSQVEGDDESGIMNEIGILVSASNKMLTDYITEYTDEIMEEVNKDGSTSDSIKSAALRVRDKIRNAMKNDLNTSYVNEINQKLDILSSLQGISDNACKTALEAENVGRSAAMAALAIGKSDEAALKTVAKREYLAYTDVIAVMLNTAAKDIYKEYIGGIKAEGTDELKYSAVYENIDKLESLKTYLSEQKIATDDDVPGDSTHKNEFLEDLTALRSLILVFSGHEDNMKALSTAIKSVEEFTEKAAVSSNQVKQLTESLKMEGIPAETIEEIKKDLEAATKQESIMEQIVFLQQVKQEALLAGFKAEMIAANYKVLPSRPSANIASVTTTTIKAVPVTGAEYSLNGVTWQGSNVFTNLQPATQYTVYVRIKETPVSQASGVSSITCITATETPDPSTVLTIDYLRERIVLNSDKVEVSTDNGETAQVLTNLNISALIPAYGDGSRTFYVRTKGSGSINPSAWVGFYVKERPAAPTAKPTVLSYSFDTITIASERDKEYSINGGASWVSESTEDNITFTGLAKGTRYTIISRYKAIDGQQFASKQVSTGTSCTTKTIPSKGPSIMVNVTETTIAVSKISQSEFTSAGVPYSVNGVEYSIDGETWITGNEFRNLKPNTQYTVYARYAETDSTERSQVTTRNVTTLEAIAGSGAVSINYERETLSYDSSIYEISTDKSSIYTNTDISSLIGSSSVTMYIRRKAAEDSVAGQWIEFELPARPAKAVIPQVSSKTNKIVNLEPVSGMEYAISFIDKDADELSWQDSPKFEGLTAGVTYNVYQRVKFIEGRSFCGEMSKSTVYTNLTSTPDVQVIAVTDTSVTLTAGDDYEYSLDMTANKTYQSSNVFTGLNPATTYTATIQYRKTGLFGGSKTTTVTFTTCAAAPTADKVSYDYNTEKVIYSVVYEMSAENTASPEIILSGSSISGYIAGYGEAPISLYVRTKASGKVPASAWTQVSVPTRGQTPEAPTLSERRVDSIKVNVVIGYKYSIDGGNVWYSADAEGFGGVFTGLTAGTEYNIIARKEADGTYFTSESSSGLTAATLSVGVAPASLEVLEIGVTELTVTQIDGAEYSLDGITWQDSNVFTGLTEQTTYTIYARAKATANSTASAAISVTATTEMDVFKIRTAEDLIEFSALVNGGKTDLSARLENDIYVNDTTGWESWDENTTGLIQFTPIVGELRTAYRSLWHGNFDGQGYTIYGLYINSSDEYVGLFGCSKDSSIRNLNVEQSYVRSADLGSASSEYYLGGILAIGENTTIENCTFKGKIYAQSTYIGGIVGLLTGEINSCMFGGSITSVERDINHYIGGIVGYGKETLNCVTCVSKGKILFNDLGIYSGNDQYMGGIVGMGANSADVVVDNCVNYASVYSDIGDSYCSGIMSGSGYVYNSVNYGKISGYCAAGICSQSSYYYPSVIVNCMNAGEVSGAGSGSSVSGVAFDASVYNCVVLGKIQKGYYLKSKKVVDRTADNCFIIPVVSIDTGVGSFANQTNIYGNTAYYEYSEEDKYLDTSGRELTTEVCTRLNTWIENNQASYPDVTLKKWSSDAECPVLGESSAVLSSVSPDKVYNKSITLSPISGVEYSVDNGETWQSSVSIELELMQDCIVYARDVNDEMAPWTVYGFDTYTYNIATAEDLNAFASYVNSSSNYDRLKGRLLNDIYLNDTSGWEGWNASTTGLNNFKPIGVGYAFSGSFNGCGHTIYGLYVNDSNIYYNGLFGKVHGSGTIKNVNVQNSYINGSACGGIVGYVESYDYSTFNVVNCVNGARIESRGTTGGILGEASGRTNIIDCINEGSVTSSGCYVGGIVGKTCNSSGLYNCINYGMVTSNYTSNYGYAGGIAGYNLSENIINCVNAGSIVVNYSKWSYTGGIVGYNSKRDANIINCASLGSITVSKSSDSVGYIFGKNYNNSAMINCISAPLSIRSTGIAAYQGSGTGAISNCYYITGLSGSAGGTELTKTGSELMSEICTILNNWINENNGEYNTVHLKTWTVGSNGYPAFAD